MAKNLFIAATGLRTGLTSVSMGLLRALDHKGVRVGFFKPVAQTSQRDAVDRSVQFIRASSPLDPPNPIALKSAQDQLNTGQSGQLMEDIVGLYHQAAKNMDVVIVEGLVPDSSQAYTARLNVEIARNLDAEVILVTAPGDATPQQVNETLDFSARLFTENSATRVIGAVLNKVGEPTRDELQLSTWHLPAAASLDWAKDCDSFSSGRMKLLGVIPWEPGLLAPRTADIAWPLKAEVLHAGDQHSRRVEQVTVCARTLPNMVEALTPGTLVVTPGDREDIIVASAMATLKGIPLAGLVLTGGLMPQARTIDFCQAALETGLPVMKTTLDTYHTAYCLAQMDSSVPADDRQRIERVMEATAEAIDADWLKEQLSLEQEPRLSPPAFRHLLTAQARAANKRIVLPEGDEPRTVRAAALCQQRGLARCVLLGNPEQIRKVAISQGVELPDDLEIIDPDEVRKHYIEPMMELRSHKGLAADMAEAQLEDNVVMATMMLALDEVDGLVSGAVHTTANTIRPALQLIKTHDHARIVSSIFFMCLPEQVLVYGDCAVNPDPNAEELADIAIQSADSAATFGIPPRVAMISYSTGVSGTGQDVEKVREATELVRKRRPELIIDGPLQYDAAAIESVAKSKAPDSPVAGRATVFIFPDLNTGNTTYKAVQRSANLVSIGPMLQGLRKPVNDLSRGAMVDDIVYTIALTAIQAKQVEEQARQ
ncbi:MAG: phosphate acetyltransferase [Halomonadaceae bacterium]|nr:MAG: phosphate acetyltransferase [Halomonadaceae bacterium]